MTTSSTFRPARRSRSLPLGSRLAVLACSALATMGLSACSHPDSAVVNVDAREDISFASFDEMFASADAVVEAKVVSSSKGRTVGSEDPLTFREVRLTVTRSWKGAAVVGHELRFEELGWSGGTPVEVNGVEPSSTGQRGVFFLVEKSDQASMYRLVNSEGRYLVAEGERVEASNHEAPAGAAHDGATLTVLRAALAKAQERADKGLVRPVAPN
jgi:hypothetical protein